MPFPDIDAIRQEISEYGIEEVIQDADEKLARFRQRQAEAGAREYNEALDFDPDEREYWQK